MKTGLAITFVVIGILIGLGLIGAVRRGEIVDEDDEILDVNVAPAWFWISITLGWIVAAGVAASGIIMLVTDS